MLLNKRTLCPMLAALLFATWQRTYARNRVELTDFEFHERRTPKHQPYSAPSAVAESDWLQTMVEYRAHGGGDGWIDEVELQWHVLIRRPGDDIILHKSVTYVDVEEGKQRAVVYIRPRFIMRYADGDRLSDDDLMVMVFARVNGGQSDWIHHPSRKPQLKWWEEGEEHTPMKGELFSRDETPFAPLDHDL